MSQKKSKMAAHKRTLKDLLRFLRALVKDDAFLICQRSKTGEAPKYHVCIPEAASHHVVFRPDSGLVKHCIAEDLLIKTNVGWVIGQNGRLALRRMLAGTDPFGEQHQDRKIRQRKLGGRTENVVVNDRSSPLGWLSRRKDVGGKPMISTTQFAAGERLAQDFQFAGMAPRITSSWSGFGSGMASGGQRRSAPGAGIEICDNRLAARQRVRRAINEVGRDLADMLLDICCFQQGLSEAEKNRGWPRRSGKIILQIALDRLADHYGMGREDHRNDRPFPISHWGDEGYKPTISRS